MEMATTNQLVELRKLHEQTKARANTYVKTAADLEVSLADFKKQVGEYEATLSAKQHLFDVNKKVIAVYNNYILKRNDSAKTQLTYLINYALKQNPETENYAIYIEPTTTSTGNRVELDIYLVDQVANKRRSLRVSSGTMVAQLVAFIHAFVLINFGGNAHLMVLDEKFSGVQDTMETIATLAGFITGLTASENFQIIFIEHNSKYSLVDGVYNVNLELNDYAEGLISTGTTYNPLIAGDASTDDLIDNYDADAEAENNE